MTHRAERNTVGLNSELFLFEPPITNVGIESVQWSEIRPINQLTEEGSIDLVISGNGSQYLDLRRSRLYVKAKITREDSSPLQSEDSVAPTNNWMHSLFSEVNVYFQQKLVSSSGTNYPYRAIFDVYLNYGKEARETQMQTVLYYGDTAGAMDSTDNKVTASSFNRGFYERSDLAANSRLIDMEGVLHSDVSHFHKYLINGVEVRLRLFQAKNSFRIMGNNEDQKYKVILTDVVFKACRVTLSPGLLTAQADAIKQRNALYPFTRTEVKTFALAQGSYNVNLDDMFQGQIPSKVVIGFVKGAAYAGNYKLNPFNFHHFNIEFLALYANGQCLPARGLTPNFSGNNYVECYQTLFTGMGIDHADLGTFTTKSEYSKGFTLFCYDLDSHVTSFGQQPALKKGILSLECRFAQELGEVVNVIVYAQFPGMLEIDQARAVLL